MFKQVLAAALLVGLAAPASAAATMSVSTFLAKAESLKKKGPLALMSGDLKLVMNQIKADSAALRGENKALEAAGRPKHYCPPEGFGMDQKTVMAAMQEVPAQQRAATSTKDALRLYIARRHPCRG